MTRLKNLLKKINDWVLKNFMLIFMSFWIGDIIGYLHKMTVNGATIDAVTKKLYIINMHVDWIYCLLCLFTWGFFKIIESIRQREDVLIDFIIKVLALSKEVESENKTESTDKKEDLNEEKQKEA